MSLSLDQMLAAEEALAELRREEKNRFFTPYPKQLQFITLGATKAESAILAGNQLGKSETGAFIMACHLTGEYPGWWPGRKWDRPIVAWAAGPSSLQVRDTAQTKLCGLPGSLEAWGTGMIPKRALIRKSNARGVADAIDKLEVRHKSGGISVLTFKSYEQERIHWQGPPIDLIWCDEEPPMELYTEALARLTATAGQIYCTFTPLKGMSDVVKRYMEEDDPNRAFVQMGYSEAPHLSPEQMEILVFRYPKHEQGARLRGEPMLGQGLVWTVPDSEFITAMRWDDIPLHWFKIWGVDFGINHPFAATLLAWDKDNETFYVLKTIRMADALILQHADEIKKVAGNVPIAWPHDGHDRDRGSGEQLMTLYRKHGLLMLPDHATHARGGMSVYAGLQEMGEIMQARKWKVLDGNPEWCGEYRQYHYDLDGKLVKKYDDLLDSTRYAYMMRRYAKQGPISPGRVRSEKIKVIGATPFSHQF